MRKSLLVLLLFVGGAALAQHQLGRLTVEKIMRDPKWMGSSPSELSWGPDGGTLYFKWNPDRAASDSLYSITVQDSHPRKTTPAERQSAVPAGGLVYNSNRSACVYEKKGDIFFFSVKTGRTVRITRTEETESAPGFSFNDSRVVFTRNQDIFSWDIAGGTIQQLTHFQTGSGPGREKAAPAQGALAEEQWMKTDQLRNFDVLRSRKAKKAIADSLQNANQKEKDLRTLFLEDRQLAGSNISPDGRFISYRLFKRESGRGTVVPSYVTESGYTEVIPGRTKVGSQEGSMELYVYDRAADTVISVKTDSLPGIRDIPAYLKDYPKLWEARTKNPQKRDLSFQQPVWSPQVSRAVVVMYARDNKDRWLVLLEPAAGKISLLDRQHDDAWIAGPGIGGSWGSSHSGWIDDNLFWYQSEASGYSHLYTINVVTGEKKALTSGRYEVQEVSLSAGRKYFYLTTNEVHPGEQQFYRLPVNGGRAERITGMTGANLVSISPDEKFIAFLRSYSNKPWELYLQQNRPGARAMQITDSAMSAEFRSYPWRDPQVISFTARDGAAVFARVYRPENPAPSKPGVIFVHGAGYLQNAHKWWSSYFREYMFNNLLADNGYTVMDIDYRGSAGYGRDWRTAIYRHMGGKDLTDQVDAAGYMVEKLGVDSKHIGLYGGSYGGFITLMALFTTPDVFKAGAALRPVTDWANYNHGYTANILNEPFTDSIAYALSSPYYFAAGLKNHLLICHGMVDTNVHFQDAVKLTQRLIELGKDNWELAVYPMEDHGFVEPSSWTDEYKRIYKLFEANLK